MSKSFGQLTKTLSKDFGALSRPPHSAVKLCHRGLQLCFSKVRRLRALLKSDCLKKMRQSGHIDIKVV